MSAPVIDARQPREPAMAMTALAHLQEKASNLSAHGILELALAGEFRKRVAVVSSFGAESAVLLHIRRVAVGEGYRAGRWAGLNKDECGIHVGTDGDGI